MRTLAWLSIALSAAACSDDGFDHFEVIATARGAGPAAVTSVRATALRITARSHGDHQTAPIDADISVGAAASDLAPMTAESDGVYVAEVAGATELHLELRGVQRVEPLPELTAALVAPGPGAVATVAVDPPASVDAPVRYWTVGPDGATRCLTNGAARSGDAIDLTTDCFGPGGAYQLFLDRRLTAPIQMIDDWQYLGAFTRQVVLEVEVAGPAGVR